MEAEEAATKSARKDAEVGSGGGVGGRGVQGRGHYLIVSPLPSRFKGCSVIHPWNELKLQIPSFRLELRRARSDEELERTMFRCETAAPC